MPSHSQKRRRFGAHYRWSARFLPGFKTEIAYRIWQDRWEDRFLRRLLGKLGVAEWPPGRGKRFVRRPARPTPG